MTRAKARGGPIRRSSTSGQSDSRTNSVTGRLLEDNLVRWAEITATREVLAQEELRIGQAIARAKHAEHRAQLQRRIPVLRIGQRRLEEKVDVIQHNIRVLTALTADKAGGAR